MIFSIYLRRYMKHSVPIHLSIRVDLLSSLSFLHGRNSNVYTRLPWLLQWMVAQCSLRTFLMLLREAAKKDLSNGVATKRGGGLATKKNNFFLKHRKKIPKKYGH